MSHEYLVYLTIKIVKLTNR